jgi:hypothetical protein
LIQPVDETGLAALRRFAEQLAGATGLRPRVSVDDATTDVLFADESATAVRVEWHVETCDDESATWETSAGGAGDGSPSPAVTIVAHYARQMQALAANPRAARAFLAEPGRGRTGTRSPRKTRRRRRRKEGD